MLIIFSINRKNFYGKPIDSDIKGYEKIKKFTTEQGEDYRTGCCLLHYEYIENHYRIAPVDLSWQSL